MEIEFSVIADLPEDTQALSTLLTEFENEYHIHVQLQRMTWDEAWPALLEFAVFGEGPDVSVIGSTWSTPLISMNALRPFTRQEIAALGGADVFFPAARRSTRLAGGSQVWALPWTAYTFVVLYRRDLLKQAGIEEQTAFETPAAMAQTLSRLQAAGIETPWVIPSIESYLDLVHITASWVWGAGGDFVSSSGNHILFNQPEARAGLQAFFELYRYLPPSVHHLNDDQCFSLFAQGKAAVILAGADWVIDLAESDTAAEVNAHLGTAVPPGVPWIGGENLVIWNNPGRPYSIKRERAAVALVSYLVSQRAQVRYSQLISALPVRYDALSQLTFTSTSYAQTIERALHMGRSHQTVSLWTRIEYQLGQALSKVATDLLAHPAAEVEVLLHQHLEPLARQLDRTLKYQG
jgi:multiple sugar transport system substrate-binding protein